jgi:hypothetical protein
MFADDIRRALPGTPRTRLAELSAAVWKGFACGAVSEEDAQQLAEEIQARKAMTGLAAPAPRRVGSRPRSSASLERRRAWSAGGWMPPAIQARFTGGEAAALAVVLCEIARSGRCALPVGAIAARAGVCATTVRNALREARRLALVAVEARRVAYDRSLPNIITVISRDLALWIRTRARVEARGWVQDRDAGPQPSSESSCRRIVPTAPKRDSRGAAGTGNALPGHRSPPVTRATPPGRLGASWSRSSGRRS